MSAEGDESRSDSVHKFLSTHSVFLLHLLQRLF
jgi:hypothetical protein